MTTPQPSQTAATRLHEPDATDASLTPQQAADACVEFWNNVLAVDGSFADDHSTL